MNQNPSNFVLFLGHFHPLLVHLPIGGLVLLGILELVARVTPWKDAAKNSRWILGFVFVAACVSSACGLMLAREGGYAPHLLKWHRAAGFAITGACLLCFLLRQREQLRAYQLTLTTTLLLLAVGSHLGASLTHGSDFLTRYAPGPVRAFAGPSASSPASKTAASPIQQAGFTELIQPILRERCSSCHGADDQMANLRLDNIEGVLRGGRHGPVIRAGQPKNSPLIQRILLPPKDDDHMPPEGELQPTATEIALLEWWINAGAPAPQGLAALKPPPQSRRLPELASGPREQGPSGE